MSKYEFVISAKDKTAQAFRSINQNIKVTTAGLARIGSGTVGAAAALAGIQLMLLGAPENYNYCPTWLG